MKKLCFLLIAALVCVVANASVLPHDPATIEALISLHKQIKKAEDKALKKVALSYGTQTEVTSNTNKFHETRTALNSKLNNAYSYVVLAGAIGSTSNSLYKLIDEYIDLTEAASKTIFKKPMCTWYYTEATLALAKEVKDLKSLIATMTASGLNVMRSSMDDKLDLIFHIKSKIDSMRSLVSRTYWWCSVAATGGFKVYYIGDILNSKVTDGIAKGIINSWNKG